MNTEISASRKNKFLQTDNKLLRQRVDELEEELTNLQRFLMTPVGTLLGLGYDLLNERHYVRKES